MRFSVNLIPGSNLVSMILTKNNDLVVFFIKLNMII